MGTIEHVNTTDQNDHYDESDEEIPEHPLKEALCVRDLPKGTVFEFKDREDHPNEDEFFSTEDVLKHLNFECVDEGGSDEENSHLTPFQRLRGKMKDITPDRGVYKQVIKQGEGNFIPPRSVVTIHYNSYIEYEEEPMDSTRLRNSPKTFRLGEGEVIPGLDIAVASMRKGEISKFLVHPNYAFGSFGIPPRIPPSAVILYEVEVLWIVNDADAYEFDSLPPEERKLLPFSKVLAVCKAQNNSGNDLFRKNRIRPALKRYRKGINILENRSLLSEEEEQEQKHLLFKLYLNMSICFIKLQEPGKAEVYAKRALALDNDNTKALFRCGKALLMQNEFEQARKYLVRAQSKEPNNVEITQEIINLDKREQSQTFLEREFCKRMFEFKLTSELEKEEKDNNSK